MGTTHRQIELETQYREYSFLGGEQENYVYSSHPRAESKKLQE